MARLPYILVGIGLAGTIAYFAFFRHCAAAAEPAEPAAALEPACGTASGPIAAAMQPAVTKTSFPEQKPVQAEPVAPPASSPLNDVRRLFDEGKWRECRRAMAPIFADCDDRTRAD